MKSLKTIGFNSAIFTSHISDMDLKGPKAASLHKPAKSDPEYPSLFLDI